MLSNYVSKESLQESTLMLYEKVELNFTKARKLQSLIEEV